MKFLKPVFSQSDEYRWTTMLNDMRKKRRYIQVGIMHVFMKDLGIPVKVTAIDKALMLRGLSERRNNPKSIFADGLGGLFNVMESMSVPFKVTEKDREIMKRELSLWRDIGDGERIAWNVYTSRKFGLSPRLTSWDRKAIYRKLNQYRDWNLSYSSEFRGMRLAEMHFITRAIGLNPKASKSDISHIK